jgi:hypothetical protein
MSIIVKKAAGYRSVLVSAGILACTSGALAEQPIGDAQQQARDLLTGTFDRQVTVTHDLPSHAVRERWMPGIDPQEQARRLISGTSNVGDAARPRVAAKRHTYGDPQELAQRMVLGEEAAKAPGPKREASAAQGGGSPR